MQRLDDFEQHALTYFTRGACSWLQGRKAANQNASCCARGREAERQRGSLVTNHTSQLVMSFGHGHEGIASAYGKQRRDAKLRGTKSKAAYRELDDHEVMDLPRLEQYQKVKPKLSGAECSDLEPDTLDEDAVDDDENDLFDDALFESESEDEDEDAVDEIVAELLEDDAMADMVGNLLDGMLVGTVL